MAKVLVIDQDMKSLKSMREILASRDDHQVAVASENMDVSLSLNAKDNHVLFYGSDLEAAKNLMSNNVLDMVFFNSSFVDEKPDAWLNKIRTRCGMLENKTIPIALLTYDESLSSVRRFMNSGVADIVCMPLDWPLFIQKFDVLLSKGHVSFEKQLFSLNTAVQLDVASVVEVEQISEFGLSVRSRKPYAVGDYVVFHGEQFADSGKGEVVAKCYEAGPHLTVKGEFGANFLYVGVSSATLKSVRRWLRQEYARKKQSA